MTDKRAETFGFTDTVFNKKHRAPGFHGIKLMRKVQ